MSQLVRLVSYCMLGFTSDYGPGTTLSASHFVPGQYVDVISNSYVLFLFPLPYPHTYPGSEKVLLVP